MLQSRLRVAACALGVAIAGAVAVAAQSARTPTTTAGFDLARLAQLDTVIAEAIAAHKLPGAVVLVGRGDTTVLRKAYGQRALAPVAERMTTDTIFDLSSLTKVIATAPAVMQLVEQGRLRLIDPVATYLPEFAKDGKQAITIRDLLTHTSGLRPGVNLTNVWTGHDTAMRLISDETPTAPPGQHFVYSDLNFILLAEIVARVTKEPFQTYAATHVFAPLGMRDTMFLPPARLLPRIAPTDPAVPRGVVHDPMARRMDGVAGNAGLFSTVDDLARYCRMMLGRGALGPARVLSPLTVARMTSPTTPASEPNVRGLGWDLDSSYSGNRGDLLPLGSFGHTGFTGTSVWIDPATRVFVVFLSNRVYPDGTGDVTPLRAKVATIVAAALTGVPASETARLAWSRPGYKDTGCCGSTPGVLTGIDVLRADGFAALKGKTVGLLTNHTGVARDGTATIDLIAHAPGVTLASLFSPEHGIRGIVDAAVPSTRDEKTGLPIYSLYGTTQRPTPEMLAGLDTIVIDLQDVGARFYTYAATMAYVLEAAAPRHIQVVVLDRPNPIDGRDVEGPALDASAVGFNGYMPEIPIRHGLTMGELARLFNAERTIGADLTVVPMKNWTRDTWYDGSGLTWINPSPNMRNLYAATLYPGLGAFEQTNVSVGRGTDTPFEQVGAPWIDGPRLASALNARAIAGVRFYPVTFTPTSSVLANERCQGVFIVITDRTAVRPVRVGVEVASALQRLFPSAFTIGTAARLFGSAEGIARIRAGDDPATIAASWAAAETRWRTMAAKYLLY